MKKFKDVNDAPAEFFWKSPTNRNITYPHDDLTQFRGRKYEPHKIISDVALDISLLKDGRLVIEVVPRNAEYTYGVILDGEAQLQLHTAIMKNAFGLQEYEEEEEEDDT